MVGGISILASWLLFAYQKSTTRTASDTRTLYMRIMLLCWDHDAQGIAFECQVRTLGYIGLGFSRDSSTKNADFFIAWVENGTAMYIVSALSLSLSLSLSLTHTRSHA